MGEQICGPEDYYYEDYYSEDNLYEGLSSKFGSLILQAADVDIPRLKNKNALLMLSSLSCASDIVFKHGYWYSASFGKWTSFDGKCDYGGSGSDDDFVDDDQLALKLEDLGFPSDFGNIKQPPMVVGSCNGLICLYAAEQPNLLQVSLWNPLNGEFKILPGSSSRTGYDHHLFAFGFDDETKDYKVVLLSFFNRNMLDSEAMDGPVALECVCRVEVYSLSTNSWKPLKKITSLPGSPFPSPPDSSSELYYLNGCCIFMAKLQYSVDHCTPPSKMSDKFMISLDLTKEIITPIKLPDHHPSLPLYLSYWGKKIALFANFFYYTGVYDVNDSKCSREMFCTWVLDEESWTKIHLFEIKLGLPGERYIPRGFSNDGAFALLETGILGRGGGWSKKKKKIKLYDLVSKELKKNFISCDQVLSKVYAYESSEVSIMGELVKQQQKSSFDMVGDWKGSGC